MRRHPPLQLASQIGTRIGARVMARVRRGFTLIEVLIAAFIISLGVIGLLALFAGAARQQQSASQTTRSVFFSNSAAAVLSNNLGRLEFGASTCFQNQFEPGRWYPVHMDDQDYFLTLSEVGGCLCQDSPFFEVPLTPINLFTTNDGSTFVTRDGFDDGNLGSGQPPIASTPFLGRVFAIPGRDLDPDSVRIIISVSDNLNPGATPRQLVYSRPMNSNLSTDFVVDNNVNVFVYPLNGQVLTGLGITNPNYVAVDIRACTDASPLNAKLVVVSVKDNPSFPADGLKNNEFISQIALQAAERRSRDLISLADRIQFRRDPGAEFDRAPDMSFGLLWRQKDSVLQALIASYQLIPPSASAQWVPRERRLDYTLSSGDMWEGSPLRRVDLELGYDLGLQQYFVELENNDDLWAIEPGQLLIVEGDPTIGNSDLEIGSDGAVRVPRPPRLGAAGDADVRGILERAPRSDGRSYLSGQDIQDGVKRRLRFIAINDIVESLEDGSEWRLRPLAASVIQVTSN